MRRWTSTIGVFFAIAAFAMVSILSGCHCHSPVKPPPPVRPGPEPIEPPVQQCIPYKRGFVLPITNEPGRVVSVAWDTKGTRYATVNEAGEILVRAHDTSIVVERYSHPFQVKARQLAFTPSGDALLSAGDDGTVRIWRENREDHSFLPPNAGLQANAIAVGVANQSPFFVAGYAAKDGSGYITWRSLDPNDSSVAARKGTTVGVESVAVHKDGLITAIGLADGTIELRDTLTGDIMQSWKDDTIGKAPVGALAWNADGSYLGAASGKNFAIWKVLADVSANKPQLLVTNTSYVYDITSIGFSPDGRFFSAVSGDPANVNAGEFRFWSVEELEAKKIIEIPSPSTHSPTAIWSTAWKPDPKMATLLFGAAQGKAQAWVVEGMPRHLLTIPTTTPLSSLGYQLGERASSYGGQDGILHISLSTGLLKQDLQSPIVQIVWDEDTDHVLALTENGVLHSFDVEKETLTSSSPIGGKGTALALRRDGKGAMVGLSDGTLAWMSSTPYTAPPVLHKNAHKSEITAIVWTAAGDMLISASKDGAIQVWEVTLPGASLKLLRSFQAPAGQHGTYLRFSKEDKVLGVGMTGGHLGFWRRHPDLWKVHATPFPTSVIEWQNIRSVVLLTAGVKAGLEDYRVHMWDVEDVEKIKHFHVIDSPKNNHQKPITAMELNWNDQNVLTTSADQTVRLWVARRAYAVIGVSYGSQPLNLISRPNGAQLYVGTTNTFLHQFKLNASPAPTLRLTQAHDQAIPHMSLSTNGDRLLTAAHDGRVHGWDLTGQEPQKVLSYPDAQSPHQPAPILQGMGYNYDQTLIAVAAYEAVPDINKGHLAFWSVSDTSKPVQLVKDILRINSMAWHPKKNILVTGHTRPGMWIWERQGDKFVKTRSVDLYHPISTSRIVFESTKGELVASSSRYGDIRIWRFADGKQIQRLDTGGVGVSGIIFHPNGESIAVSLPTGQVNIWRISDAKLLYRLIDPDIATAESPHIAHQGSVTAMSWSKSENTIFTGGSDLKVKQWTCAK